MRLRHAAALAFALLIAATPSFRAEPEAKGRHRLHTVATAYCQRGTTKAGNQVRPGMIAADPDVLPLGSVVRVEVPAMRVAGVYTVDDTGGLVKGHHIDIFMPSCARAKRFGRKPATVEVLRRGEPLRTNATE